jgi:hypothetical protein
MSPSSWSNTSLKRIPRAGDTSEGRMDTFYTLHDFLVYTKGAAYYLMGAMILGFLGFWLYLNGRDEDKFIK